MMGAGCARLATTAGVDYQHPVGEYGVHWNFFFTLGLLPVFGVLLWPVRQKWMRWTILGLLLTIGRSSFSDHVSLLSHSQFISWL